MEKQVKSVLVLTDRPIPSGQDALGLTPEQFFNASSFKTSLWNLDNRYLHLMVQSFYWNKIMIQLSEPAKIYGVRHFHKCTDNITVLATEDILNKSIDFLCELLPEKAPRIRKAKMLNKSLKDILNED